MTPPFKAVIGDRIVIDGLDATTAIVRSIWVQKWGVTYEAGWFANGQRETTFLFEDEFRVVSAPSNNVT